VPDAVDAVVFRRGDWREGGNGRLGRPAKRGRLTQGTARMGFVSLQRGPEVRGATGRGLWVSCRQVPSISYLVPSAFPVVMNYWPRARPRIAGEATSRKEIIDISVRWVVL
jgi:hypothetical protein